MQVGNSDDRYFTSFVNNITPLFSSWSNYPTTLNPLSLYKFSSLEINLSRDLRVINRQTYSILDFLGDCGGLLDALKLLGELFANPVALYMFRTKIASLIVHILPSATSDRNEKERVFGENEKKR